MARGRLVTATFADADGSTFTRDVVRALQVVAMVPLLADGVSVLLVRQYRGPLDAELAEIPAGLCDVDGEALEATARRELVEEAGLEAGSLEQIARIHPAAGFTDQVVHLYLAQDLTQVPDDRQGPEEAAMTTEVVALAEVPAMIADGRLTDGKTVVGLLLARELLGIR
ncbi:MAG TPA: NUDIX hydrolase [Acidimicrobiales bacterium]